MSLILQHSPAVIARTVLVLAGVGTDPTANGDWPLFATGEPPSPDEVMTVYDTAAKPDGREMKFGQQFYHYGIQVRIRSLTHPNGLVQGEKTKVIMNEGVKNVTLTNFIDPKTQVASPYSYFVQCFTNLNLVYMGKEVPASKRSLFTLNGYVVVKRIQ